MNKRQIYEIDNRRTKLRKELESNTEELTIEYIRKVMNDAILLDYFPDIIKKMIVKWKELITLKSLECTTEKDRVQYIRRQHNRYNHINKIDKYQFFFMSGGMAYTRYIYSEDHKDAWKKANNITEEEYGGNVRCVLCISINDKDTGTLHELKYMFKPKTKGRINSIKAEDLLIDWENLELKRERKDKLRQIK